MCLLKSDQSIFYSRILSTPQVRFDNLPHLLPSAGCALLLIQMECAGSQICLLAQLIGDHRLQSKCGGNMLLQMAIHEVYPHPQIVKGDVYISVILAVQFDVAQQFELLHHRSG